MPEDGYSTPRSSSVGDGCLDPQCESTGYWTARVLENGKIMRNVYPMAMTAQRWDEDGEPIETAPESMPLLFAKTFGVIQAKTGAVDPSEAEKKVVTDND